MSRASAAHGLTVLYVDIVLGRQVTQQGLGGRQGYLSRNYPGHRKTNNAAILAVVRVQTGASWWPLSYVAAESGAAIRVPCITPVTGDFTE